MANSRSFSFAFVSAVSISLVVFDKVEAASFDFSTPSPTSSSFVSVNSGGNTFTLSDAQWTNGVTSGIRQNSFGVCVWAVVGSTGGRCNVNPADSISNVGASLTSLKGKVSLSSIFKSFNIGQYEGTIANALIQFKVGGTVRDQLNITSLGLYTLDSPIFLTADDDLEIITSGQNSDPVNGSVIRISTFNIDNASVPGPLPLIGTAAAFGWSRKLRRHIKASVK